MQTLLEFDVLANGRHPKFLVYSSAQMHPTKLSVVFGGHCISTNFSHQIAGRITLLKLKSFRLEILKLSPSSWGFTLQNPTIKKVNTCKTYNHMLNQSNIGSVGSGGWLVCHTNPLKRQQSCQDDKIQTPKSHTQNQASIDRYCRGGLWC